MNDDHDSLPTQIRSLCEKGYRLDTLGKKALRLHELVQRVDAGKGLPNIDLRSRPVDTAFMVVDGVEVALDPDTLHAVTRLLRDQMETEMCRCLDEATALDAQPTLFPVEPPKSQEDVA